MRSLRLTILPGLALIALPVVAAGSGTPPAEPPRSPAVPGVATVHSTGAAIVPGGSVRIELADIATGDPEALAGVVRAHTQGEYLDRQPGYSGTPGVADAEEHPLPADPNPPALRGDAVTAAGDVLRNFDGQVASGWIPPDPVLAVGPKYIVEMVNSGFTIYSKDGGLDRAYTNLETFFAPLFPSLPDPWVGADSFVFDPRVIYTPFHNRFVVFALARDDNHLNSYWFFAISTTSNPLGGWTLYWYWDANNQDTWIDYSGMSADYDGLYFTGNEYYWAGGYKHSIIHAIRPTIFTNTGGAGWIFWDLRWNEPGTPLAFNIQPAVPHSDPMDSATFFVNTFNSSGDKACLWKLTGDRGSSPLLAWDSVTVASYADPGLAAQPGAVPDDIEMLYAGVVSAAYNQRKVFFSLNDDNGNGASFYVSKIDVDALSQDLARNLGATDVYYYYPAVGLAAGPDPDNPLVGVTMSWSSNTQYPSGAFKLFENFSVDNSGDFWNVISGSATYNVYADGRNRWGDYMGIHRDWSCGTIWGVTQYAPSLNTWRTRITELAGQFALPASCRLIFDDGFERGSSLNWSSTAL